MEFQLFDLGTIDFETGLKFQKDIFEKVRSSQIESALIFCQHLPVITMGRLAKAANILASDEQLRSNGVGISKIDRGGDVTYHGPGQLIAYPIFNFLFLKKDLHLFLRNLERTAIEFLADFNVKAGRKKEATGVWVGEEKIASIGVAVKKWISYHGLAINISKASLRGFGLIRPCGMNVKMTSLETILGSDVKIEEAKKTLLCNFKNVFN